MLLSESSRLALRPEPVPMPLDAAVALLASAGRPVTGFEEVAVSRARGRVLAAPVVAAGALPPFDNSAMDGYALAGRIEAGQAYRLVGRAAAGEPFREELRPGEAVRILTGAVVPPGTTAILRQEDAELGPSTVRCRTVPVEGANIRRAGEDVGVGDALIPPGTRIETEHIALLAALGVATIRVRRRVRVAVLSTGSELRQPGETLVEGAVYDANRAMLLSLLDRGEFVSIDGGIVPDHPLALADRLFTASESADLVITSGGASAGETDHLRAAALRAGGSLDSLHIALKPGRPLGLGRIGRALVLGLPGNPLAALAAYLLLGRPLLDRLAGLAPQPLPLRTAIAGFARKSDPLRTELFPARIRGEDHLGRPLVEPTGSTGAARLRPLLAAEGFCVLAPSAQATAPGDRVSYLAFREPAMA